MKSDRDLTPVLAGDIGGTKTYLGLFVPGKGRPSPQVVETFSSRDGTGLDQIIERFIKDKKASIRSACFGIAGPVVNGRCRTTNLPWVVSEEQLMTHFKWPRVRLLNDITATVLAIPLLRGPELHVLNRGRPVRGGPKALIASGTGLGMAFLIYQGDTALPISSEGGHAGFCPTEEDQFALWQYLKSRFGHASAERVLSGPGLYNIYNFLASTNRFEEPLWLREKIRKGDPSRNISELAIQNRHTLCLASLDLFITIFGAMAGNLALTGLTTGGVYLGGGIPPKILPRLDGDIFMAAFTQKGRFSEFLKRIPVRVMLNDKAGLLGAATEALRMEEDTERSARGK
jgi:glucokinase